MCCDKCPDCKSNARSLRSGKQFAAWFMPVIMLIATPKCPLCVAGYVIALTGFGITLQTAATLRWAWLATAALALLFLSLRFALRRMAKNA